MKTALYMPARNDGEVDPSREFETEQEAWQYIFDGMCKHCKEDRELYLKLQAEGKLMDNFTKDDPEYWASEYPACSCEWFVVDSDELKECETFHDILSIAGYNQVIYRKPTNDNDIDSINHEFNG